ncbi:MAG: E3 ubiquitin ligase family protein [Candidatus Accumulibacter sp.]|nr:E3 ubiquitin ligase family protein [Accumulibacter sp.]
MHSGLLAIGIRLDCREGWTICIGLIAIISLVAWMFSIWHRRAITDTPASRIASAAQGYVELSGTGRPLDAPPLLSHVTCMPCLWYRRESYVRSGSRWIPEDKDESVIPFIIDDGTGRCVVDPEGAEIITRHMRTRAAKNRRTTEWLLLPNDAIYALGEFRTLGGGTVELDARRDLNDLLTAWKKDRPNLLRRFDLDRDGEISEKEWGLARQAARREVSKMHREARAADEVHTLRCPAGGRHYLISNLDPNKMSRHYLRWSFLHLAVFLIAFAALPWAQHQPSAIAKYEQNKLRKEANQRKREEFMQFMKEAETNGWDVDKQEEFMQHLKELEANGRDVDKTFRP